MHEKYSASHRDIKTTLHELLNNQYNSNIQEVEEFSNCYDKFL